MKRIVARFVASIDTGSSPHFPQIKTVELIQTENNKFYIKEEMSGQLTEIKEEKIIKE